MKKRYIILSVAIILIIFIGTFYFYRHSNSYAANQVYKVANNHNRLKKLCANEKTYDYIIKNRNEHFKKLTDDQGSGNIFYYSGLYGNKTIGIEGHFTTLDSKVEKIFLN